MAVISFRYGCGLAGAAIAEKRRVAVAHGPEHALHHVLERVRQAPRQPRGVLHAAAPALARAHHVLVDADEQLPGLVGVLAEVARLARELVDPPEADVAARPRQRAVLDQARERAADLEQVGAAAAVVVGRGHLLLDVRGQHDLLVVDLAAADPGLDHRLLGLLGVVGLDVDLDAQRRPGGRELLLQREPAPRRDHDREAGRACRPSRPRRSSPRTAAGPRPPGRGRRSPPGGSSSTTRSRARRASTPPRARRSPGCRKRARRAP